MTRRVVLLLALLAMLVAAAPPSAAASGDAPRSALAAHSADVRLRAVEAGLAWLAARQYPDGGFGLSGGSDWIQTSLVAQAFLIAGEDPATLTSSSDKTAIDYLATAASSVRADSYEISQMILGSIALGQDPASFAGVDWLAQLGDSCQADGQYATLSVSPIEAQASAFLALRSAYQPVPERALVWLRDAAGPDGGWGAVAGLVGDPYHTGLALRALILAGEPIGSPAIRGAVAFLAIRQGSDRGFGGEVEPTAAAIQGLAAAGAPLLSTPWAARGWSPYDALLALQSSDGSFAARAGEGATIEATVAGLRGLLGHSGPLRERHLAAARAVEWLHTQQGEDGGFGPLNTTADAVYAIVLAGQDPDGRDWTPDSTSALAALADLVPEMIALPRNTAAEVAKAIRAVSAAGGDPRAFGGCDLVAHVQGYYDAGTGHYYPEEKYVYRQDIAVLGLLAVNEPVPDLALEVIAADQGTDGGWGWYLGSEAHDIDSTGRTMQALAAAGYPLDSPIFGKAAQFIAALQLPDGSLPDRAGAAGGNSDSVALAIEGLLAAGRDPRDAPFVAVSPEGALVSLLDALLRYQEDDGAFIYTVPYPESRLLAVLDAVPALLGDFPPYQRPAPRGPATTAGEPRLSRQGDGYVLVAPYEGDGNDNGMLSVRIREAGSPDWSAPLAVRKSAVAYVVPLDAANGVEVIAEYQDADGVEGGELVSSFTIRPHLPLIIKVGG